MIFLAAHMLFSIIITSHNQREFIRNAVDSALNISRNVAEVIVVDDASSDGSQQLLRGYGDAIRFAPLEVHGGACAARNRGVSLANGEYLVFLDGDDALLPWALTVYSRMILSRTPKILLASKCQFSGELPQLRWNQHRGAIEFVEYRDYMKKDRTFPMSASALVLERRALLEVGGWSEDVLAHQDAELLMKLSDSGRTIQIRSPFTCLYRIHIGNIWSRDPERYVAAIHTILARERSGQYPGGPARRFERYALLGGHLLSTTRNALGRKAYADALRLVTDGWPVFLVAVARRVGVRLRGRLPCRTIPV